MPKPACMTETVHGGVSLLSPVFTLETGAFLSLHGCVSLFPSIPVTTGLHGGVSIPLTAPLSVAALESVVNGAGRLGDYPCYLIQPATALSFAAALQLNGCYRLKRGRLMADCSLVTHLKPQVQD